MKLRHNNQWESPKKPETEREQISTIWDYLFNHVRHRLMWQDRKFNFVLAIVAVVLGVAVAVLCHAVFGG